MRRLIEKFYALGPVKRLILVILMIFSVSLTTTAYSFYNMSLAVKEMMSTGDKNMPYLSAEEINKNIASPFVPEHIYKAVEAIDYLAELSRKIEVKNSKSIEMDFDFAGLGQEQNAELVENIAALGKLQWEEISILSSSQIDPFDFEDGLLNFKNLRYASRLMSRYIEYIKEKSPEQETAAVFASMLKLGRITEAMSPYLIGKMIALALDGIAIRPFKRCYGAVNELQPKTSLFDLNLVSASEAAEMKKELLKSLKLEAPFHRSLKSEFVFFKQFAAKLYEKAPLAAYILNQIFGNPESEYKQIIERPADKDLLMKTLQGWKNPVLLIAVPNFTRAYQGFQERQAQKAVLAAELSAIAGENEQIRDPFSNGMIKSLEVDGITKFYSVGPDGIDDKLGNDDVSLYLIEKKEP